MQTSPFPTREVHPQQLRRGDAKVDEQGHVVAQVLRVKKNAHGPDQTDVLWEGYALPHTYANHRLVTIAAGVVCGNCSTKEHKVQHPTTQDVRDCFTLRYDQEFQIREEYLAEQRATRYWEEGF
jgi:hypothetical protein